MDTKGIRLLDRIGRDGLRAAVGATFDRAGLVDIANACQLKFPGKRAQTVGSDAILDEMVKRFLEDDRVRAAVMKALIRANQAWLDRLRQLTPAETTQAIAALPDDETGRALFALGDLGRESARTEIRSLRARLGLEPLPAPAPREGDTGLRRLEEEIDLLRQRAGRLDDLCEEKESLVAQLRASESELQQALLSARKETHHLRKEVARLDQERQRLQEQASAPPGAGDAASPTAEHAARLEDLSYRVNQIIRENRKIAHDLSALLDSRAGPADPGRPYFDAVAAAVEALRREVGALRAEREEESSRVMKLLQDLATEINMTRSDLAQWRRTMAEPQHRKRGEPDRVGLFVDVQNMYYAARQLNARLDFGALMTAATRDRRLIRAYAYVVQNRDIDQSSFLAMLQQRNYEVRRKDLKIRHDGSSKGDWDMEMALDMLRLAPNLDVVVLVSGDGDFVSLVAQIKTLGPRVEVYSFTGSTAKELIEAADRHVPIDEGFLIRMPSPA